MTAAFVAMTCMCLTPAVLAQGQSDVKSSASGGQKPAVDDLSLEDILGMEVQSVFGASKFLQKTTEAPAAVTIVTADEIQRYGWLTLADVLRNVRGFYVTDDRSWAYVGVRGFQRPGDYNTRVLMLVDGERINDNVYDQALLQEDFVVDLNDVDRIEIIRGPSSSLYGSSAFFGVINVVTRPPAQAVKPAAMVDLGTLGFRTGRMSIGRQLSNGVAFAISTTGQTADGVDAIYFPEFDTPASNFGIATGLDYRRRRNVMAKLDFKSFKLRTAYNSRTRGYPSGAYGTAFNDPRSSLRDESFFVSTNWDAPLRAGWTGTFRLGFHHYRYLGHYPSDIEADGWPVDNIDIGRGKWVVGEARFSRRVGGGHHVTLGLEQRQDLEMTMLNYYEGQEPLLDVRRQNWTLGAYVQDEWRLHKKVLLSAGLRQDHYGSFGDPLKPRLAAVYRPQEDTAVKVLYGGAFRAPNAFERECFQASAYKTNLSLRPEDIRTVEGVIEHYAGRRLRLTGSLFRYNVSKLIDLRPDSADNLSCYDNIDSARASGLEAEAEAKWPNGVQAKLSYTHSRVREASGLPLTNAPAHLVQGLFSAPLIAGTIVGLDMRAMSSRLTAAGGPVGAHVVPNLTLSGPVLDKRLRYTFSMSNVTNQQYADPLSTDFVQAAMAQYGRQARFRLFWTF